MSESTEQESEESAFEEAAEEIIVEVPIVESGSYLYVCSQCGFDLTEIPNYNRFYCQNCGLHY